MESVARVFRAFACIASPFRGRVGRVRRARRRPCCRPMARWSGLIRSRRRGGRRGCLDGYEWSIMIGLRSVAFGLYTEYEESENAEWSVTVV